MSKGRWARGAVALTLVGMSTAIGAAGCSELGLGGVGGAMCPELKRPGDVLSTQFSANAQASAKIAAFVQASKDMAAVSTAIEAQVADACRRMGADLGIPPARHGYLKHWAEQGVLLLNNCLTVEAGMAASHQGKGWEKFTDAAVAVVAADPAPKVFILWGSHAQRKAANVPGLGPGSPHLILRAPHPSPLSAHNGFFGSKPFSQANAFLEAHGRGTIDWRLPENPDIAAS